MIAADFRKHLPHRPRPRGRDLPGPERAAVRAALHARAIGLTTVPVTAWRGHPSGSAHARLDDDTVLVWTHDQPGGPTFTANVPCPGGACHEYPVHRPGDLENARDHTATCTTNHQQETRT